MIAKTYILRNLTQLDSAFRRATTQRHAVYFSKLAILELCGWIEISMDEIVMAHCSRHVADSANIGFFTNDVVRRTYGFDYKSNFRRMLINLVGIVTCEKLEARIPVAVQTKLMAQLNSLKVARNGLAHTYLKGPVAMMAIDAPSVTKSRFNDIYTGLKSFDHSLRLL
jgi:hypothetical protein